MIPFRSPAEILGRLELSSAGDALLVGAPPEFEAILRNADASAVPAAEAVAADAIRSVKDRFDFVLLWQEDRVGSEAALHAARKRLRPGGRLWVATARTKVQGPRVAAAHRLNLADLNRAFAKEGLTCDREVRLSAWHTAYRFVDAEAADSGSAPGSKIPSGR